MARAKAAKVLTLLSEKTKRPATPPQKPKRAAPGNRLSPAEQAAAEAETLALAESYFAMP